MERKSVVKRIKDRLLPDRSGAYRQTGALFDGRKCLEIGGLSWRFTDRGSFPIYRSLASCDNVNFANDTIWVADGGRARTFAYHKGKPPGRQFIAEAFALSEIAGQSYDAVISSHMVEHSANPLRVLNEWRRVLRPDGVLLLVVPHKDGTFDHRRPVTPLGHLVEDLEAGTEEDDTTHMDEIVALHDLDMNTATRESREQLAERAGRNLVERGLHHHVFDTRLAEAMVRQAGFHPICVEARRPYDITIVAHCTATAAEPVRFASPFPSDAERLAA